MNILRININSTIDLIKSDNNYLKTINNNILQKGNDNINLLYKWKYEDNIIKCYGYYDGITEYKNSHQLPANGTSEFLEDNSSEITLYGNIFIIKLNKNNELLSYNINEYGEFYNIMFDFDNNYLLTSESDDHDLELDNYSNNSLSDGDDIEIDVVNTIELDYDNNKY